MKRGAKSAKAKANRPLARPRQKKRAASGEREVERRLAEALEQQAATHEILRAISGSPADVQPVFDAIVESASRLCEAEFSVVTRFEDGRLHLVAVSNMSPAETAAYRSLFPRPPDRGFVIGRAFVEARALQVEDVLADPEYEPRTLQVLQGAARYRSYLGIPIIRHGAPIGVIGCGRRQVKPFTPAQIELMKTFADQAVIAIENVRLFKELDARTHELTRSVGELQALGEVSQAVSSRWTSTPCSPPSSAAPSSSRAATRDWSTASTARPRLSTTGRHTASSRSTWSWCGWPRSDSARARSGGPESPGNPSRSPTSGQMCSW
jgi:transcriptional regulator with GAF, ATPase, and Fis domain